VKSLNGKITALTGASSGIGRALAIALAAQGGTVAIADRDADGLAETARLARAAGGTISTHALDVTDEAAVDAFAAAVVTEHGAVDVVINNAGVSLFGSVLEASTDEMKWLMDVNFWGVVYGCKAFLPALLRRPEATIVNISSLFGLYGPPGQSAYAASKFAVRGYSESLRGEMTNTKVHVVTVHPAGIKTNIAKSGRVAAAADPVRAAKMTKKFDERFLTIAPERAAADIIRGIVNNADRVLIGADAVRIDVMTRLLGPRAQRIFNNAVLKGAK
jgi:short-subunit dehydrogenase